MMVHGRRFAHNVLPALLVKVLQLLVLAVLSLALVLAQLPGLIKGIVQHKVVVTISRAEATSLTLQVSRRPNVGPLIGTIAAGQVFSVGSQHFQAGAPVTVDLSRLYTTTVSVPVTAINIRPELLRVPIIELPRMVHVPPMVGSPVWHVPPQIVHFPQVVPPPAVLMPPAWHFPEVRAIGPVSTVLPEARSREDEPTMCEKLVRHINGLPSVIEEANESGRQEIEARTQTCMAAPDTPDSVKTALAEALGGASWSEATKVLVGLLRVNSLPVQLAATRSLAKIRDPGTIEALTSVLAPSGQSELRQSALAALCSFNVAPAEAEVIRLLTDEAETLRLEAVKCLGEIGRLESIPRLEPLLRDPNLDIQIRTAETIRKIRQRVATSP